MRGYWAVPVIASIIFVAALVNNSSFAQNLESSSEVSHITLLGEVNVASLNKSEKVAVQAIQVPSMSKDSSSVDFAKTPRLSEQYSIGIQASSPQSSGQVGVRAPQVSTGFEGLGEIESGSFIPPDVQLAAGPNHLVEMVNSHVKIWTKDGTPVTDFSLASLFLFVSEDPFDPKIFFDHQSDRWFASVTSFSNNLRFAVSTTNDPTGTWFVYNISYGSTLPDQPRIGASDDKFVISTNDFAGGVFFIGAHYFILDKNQMLTGSTITNIQEIGPDNSRFSIVPVRSLSSTLPLYMVSIDDFVDNTVTLYTITGSAPTAIIQTFDLPIIPASFPPDAVQMGTLNLIATGDNRIQDAAWFDEDLWFALNDSCIPSGDTISRSCVHLVQIDTLVPGVTQDFLFGANGFHYFYPAISIDTLGGLGLVFGFSSTATFPSIAVSGQPAGDPINTLEDPVTVKAGSDFNPTSRHGDYFGAALDPSDPTRIFVAGQYYKSPNWSTWITDFVFDNGAVVPVAITDLSLTVVSGTQVDLSWTTPNNGGSPILSFDIFRNLNGAGFALLQSVADPTLTAFSDNTLTSGDQVKYGVRAVNAIGNALPSNLPPPVTTTGSSVPDAVTDLALTVVSGTQVDLSWSTASSSTPLLGYKVYRNLNGAGFVLLLLLPDPLATSFSDTTLSPGDQVRYGLIAVNPVGSSAPSNIPPFVSTPP